MTTKLQYDLERQTYLLIIAKDIQLNYLAYYVITDEYEDALRDLIAEKISGKLDISSLKNRIIEGDYRYGKRTLIPMRRIEL